MKKLTRILALLCALFLLLSLGAAAEGEEWSEEYYRIIDYTDELSDAEIASLDEDCIAIISEYQVDMALLAVENTADALRIGNTVVVSGNDLYEGKIME